MALNLTQVISKTSSDASWAMKDGPFLRPQSVIKIMEIPDASVSNPQPAAESIGEFISSQKLKDISGCSNLNKLSTLKLKVDTTDTSIGSLGLMAPNLKTLNLNNSFITTVRDLGTSLNNLQMLCLSRCCLTELDGISCISALKELYLAFNEIVDISPLSMLEHLQVLDLEGNCIDDITQVEFLSLCTQLKVLTLKGNPLVQAPTSMTNTKDLKFYVYREAVLSCLPQLNVLDDEPFLVDMINGEYVKRSKPTVVDEDMPFKDDLCLIQNNLKNMEVVGNEDQEEDETLRPVSARRRCLTTRTRSAMESTKGDSHSSASEDLFDSNDCSDLTYGNIMCGNPVQALRKRHKTRVTKTEQKDNTNEDVSVVDQLRTCTIARSDGLFRPERSYLSESEQCGCKDDIFEELRLWRKNNGKLFEDEVSEDVHTEKAQPSPVFSPMPPTVPKASRISPCGVHRSLPSPPSSVSQRDNRPQTAGDIRSRRYRVISPDSTKHSLGYIEETFPKRNTTSASFIHERPATRAALEFTP